MAGSVRGIVKDGLVVPEAPLPEGAEVEIHLRASSTDVPSDLQAELAAWQRASANALELVERLAEEGTGDAPR
jgi:hypothetical protein